MASAESVLQAIKDTKPMDLVQHPLTFAVGVGLANGLLATVRGKEINFSTGVALAVILGLGEAAINHFEHGPKKYSDLQVALHSVVGVGLGVAPFVKLGSEGSKHIPVAETETASEVATA